MRRTFTTLASLLSFAIAAAAQNCSDNTWPIRLVDQTGTLLPTTGSGSGLSYLPPNEMVYLAVDPGLPSGLYYVHVTDPIGGHDEVLSMNDATDRFVQVTNNAGVITLALPFSVNPDVPAFGAGLNGVGQSLPLFPFRSASWDPCSFKAWLGNSWGEPLDPNNPYLLAGGYDASAGVCRIRSYTSFRIGDGTGSDVTGLVFDDQNRNGVRDSGEPGVAGEEVRLVSGSASVSTLTDTDGTFRFVDVAAGSYTVDVTFPTGTIATTPTSQTVEVCGCSDVDVAAFGRAVEHLRCDGHTIGYWRNCHGLRLIAEGNLLPQLNALCLVDACGRRRSFATLSQFACWLQDANATNMAYMLSAQLAAMYLNIAVGFVDAGALITDPNFGTVPIGDIVAAAMAELCAHGYTPRCSSWRAYQEQLKNALDDANNNRSWVDCDCTDEPPTTEPCSPSPCRPKPSCRPKAGCSYHPEWRRRCR